MQTTTRRTFCRICEAACGLVADVDAGGAVTRLVPDRQHPVSAGFVCAKGTRFHEVTNHPNRLRHPMRRRLDGALERISWDAAFDLIGQKVRPIIERHGPHAVGVYWGNPLAFDALGTLGLLMFSKALDSRNFYSAGSQDCNNKFAGAEIVHGSPFIHPVPDVDRTDLAVLFGTNPAISQGSFVHLDGGSTAFDRLIARGGRTVFIDPRETESAARWGGHLGIRPGTDVWLLLALLRLLADREAYSEVTGLDTLVGIARRHDVTRAAAMTGISVAQIQTLAEQIKRAGAVVFHMGVGVNMGPFGTLAYVLQQALSYVTGNMDRAGGSLFHPMAFHFDRLAQSAGVGVTKRISRIGGYESVLDTLPGGILADEITTRGHERVRAMFVAAGDPVRSIPRGDKLADALEQLDFLVSIDLFENETGRRADLLLPTPTWLERWDLAMPSLLFQTGSLLQSASPVTHPPGDVRSELEIFGRASLALGRPLVANSRRLTRAFLKAPIERWLDRATRGFGGGYGVPIPGPVPGSAIKKSKLRFWDDRLDAEVARMVEVAAILERRTGFTLICRRRRIAHNSWLQGGSRDGNSETVAWLSPADADTLGVGPEGGLRIQSAHGAIELPVRAKKGITPGTVVVPHGLPDVNVNALLPSGEGYIERLSGMLWMTGVPVEVSYFKAARFTASAT